MIGSARHPAADTPSVGELNGRARAVRHIFVSESG